MRRAGVERVYLGAAVVGRTRGGANFACDGGRSWDSYPKRPFVAESECHYVGIGGLCASTYESPLGFRIDGGHLCRQFLPPTDETGHILLKKAVYLYDRSRSGEEGFMTLRRENPQYSNCNCNVSTLGNRTMIDHVVLLTGWQTHNDKSTSR
jgi:hypothetical protein